MIWSVRKEITVSIQPNRSNTSPITHVYLAGPYGAREKIREFAEEVWEAGFVVTSRWHDLPKNDPSKRDRKTDQRISAQNWHDMGNSDVVIAVADTAGRGTLVEIGGAIASGKVVLIAGNPNDVTLMVDLPGSTFFAADLAEALEMLAAQERADDGDDDDDDDEDE